ncbi:hypothetical protein C370_04908 [Cryptococcus neoformans A1-35-8]|nr:hypothetical protein C369_04830 [Cryptococcus neoformans var. grubii A5-35-17]OXH07782.1 hypothetical protein C370_04908 [Cryptococcus neoformans var. grubii A1-35-8]
MICGGRHVSGVKSGLSSRSFSESRRFEVSWVDENG